MTLPLSTILSASVGWLSARRLSYGRSPTE